MRRGEFHHRTRRALRGKNYSGKSSILKLLPGGEVMEYSGKLTSGGELRISYVAPPRSCAEARGSARASRMDESLFRRILYKLRFPKIRFEKGMADYSGGRKKKVLLVPGASASSAFISWTSR